MNLSELFPTRRDIADKAEELMLSEQRKDTRPDSHYEYCKGAMMPPERKPRSRHYKRLKLPECYQKPGWFESRGEAVWALVWVSVPGLVLWGVGVWVWKVVEGIWG